MHLLVRECEGIIETEVERVMAAELGAETSPGDQTQDPTWVVARCIDNRVIIEVTDGISRKTLKRSFNLGSAPARARGRLIAIAASELVLAGWSELAVRPKLRVEPEGDAPPQDRVSAAVQRAQRTLSDEHWPVEPEAPAPSGADVAPVSEKELRPERRGWFVLQPPEQRSFRLVPLAAVRGFFGHEGLLKGGGLRLGEERLVGLGWAVDALVETGTIDAFEIDNYTLGAQLYLHTGSRYVALRAGAGLRAGLASSTPPKSTPLQPGENEPVTLTAREPSSSPVPWGWPMLAFSVTVGARGGPVFELSGEGGYVALPVEGGRYGTSIRGPWFGVQAGIGFAQ